MPDPTLRHFHETYIRATAPGKLVVAEIFVLATLTNEVAETLQTDNTKVYVRSIVLKHIYEKRTPYVYDFIIDHLVEMVRFPDTVYKNAPNKRGDYIFCKTFGKETFACLIETNAHPETGQPITAVITAFKTNERYVQKFEPLRSWKDGTPSS